MDAVPGSMKPVTTAIFGLLGVAVGALIAGGFAVYVDHRREARFLRTARRMLRLELKEASHLLDKSKPTWVAQPERVLSNEQWAEHRSVWGANADDEAWDAVSSAFLAIADLRRANLGIAAGSPAQPASFAAARAAIDKALPHLEASQPD